MSIYTVFKNHLHNTLGITKDDVRQMVEASVESIVERKLEVLFNDKFSSKYDMERIIDDSIRDKSMSFWGDSEDRLDDYIKRRVVQELLNGVKLKVEIARTKKEATPPPATLTIRKRRGKFNG